MNVCAVLVRPKYPSNIGAAARALANLAGERLILIDRKCEVNSKARQGAAGAQEMLAHRTEYDGWSDFYEREGKGLRIGLTRRSGKTRTVTNLKDTLCKLKESGSPLIGTRIYVIFGPEDNGLNAEDLKFVHHICHLPVYGPFNSLNLAQAVLLTLYVVSDVLRPTLEQLEPSPLAEPMYFPEETIRQWLEAIGFQLEARKASALITFRKLVLQNTPTERELMILDAILQQNIRKLNEFAKH